MWPKISRNKNKEMFLNLIMQFYFKMRYKKARNNTINTNIMIYYHNQITIFLKKLIKDIHKFKNQA